MKPIVLLSTPSVGTAEYARMLELELTDRGLTLVWEEAADPAAVLFVCGAVTPTVTDAATKALERYTCPILCCATDLTLPLPSGVIALERPLNVKLFCDGLAAAAKGEAELSLPVTHASPPPKDLVLDHALRRVTCCGVPITLTTREYQLLALLDEHRGTPVSREEAALRIWGEHTDTNVVDVYIRYLRQKLDERFDARYILTIRGKGYQLKAPASFT